MTPRRRITFMCCFCGQPCPGDVQIALITNAGSEKQQEEFWFAHYGCFENSLHPSAKNAIEQEGD